MAEIKETYLDRTCEHGKTPNWWWKMLSGANSFAGWNGPLATCRCCGAEFGYINSSAWSGGGALVSKVHFPRDLCTGCGGHLKEFG